MNTKVACGMIVKSDDEADMLRRCLNTVAPYVDAIFITVTQNPHIKIEAICKQYGANLDIRPGEFNIAIGKKEVVWIKNFLKYEPTVKEGDILFNFGAARQANLEFIPDEFHWLFWIDCDDILRNGEFLKTAADEAYANNVEALFLNYIYQADIENNEIKRIVIQHLRERLVRIDGDYRKVYKWIGMIHETLIQQRETNKVEDPKLDILHLSNMERFNEALQRNLKILEYEIYNTKGADPRPIYYLGKAYFDVKTAETDERAEDLMRMYLAPNDHQRNMSGWAEERAQAWEYLAELMRTKGEHNNSAKCLMNSLIEFPQNPSTFFNIALTCMLKEQWENARFWTIMGTYVPSVRSTLVSNPRDEETRALEVIYNCAIHTNRIDEAFNACRKLVDMYPNDQAIQQQWGFINDARVIRDATKNYMWMVSYLNQIGEGDKVKALLNATPSTLSDNPLVVRLQQDLNPPRIWGDDEIAIYCGGQWTGWSPKGIENPQNTFVGGSEEAIIYLSQELAKQGWKVTVYADPGNDEGEYNEVNWQPYYRCNKHDKFNILVYWRAIGMVDIPTEAKKKYLWCHDVQNPAEFTKERLEKLDKIIVLSKAHRDNLPDIPDDKFIISTNGYYEHFPDIKPKNNAHWCLYTSSYDRGLEHLLTIWPDVKAEVPDAQLHVFYGWQLFKQFFNGNPERMAWLRKIEELMKVDGITHHGRVPQTDIEKWYKKCGVFAYPSHFYEINCISAIKAQLWGAVPVTTTTGALATTVQYGIKIEGDIWDPDIKEKYKQALIKALKDEKWQEEQRKLMMPWARENFSWTKVAEEWTKQFKKEVPNALSGTSGEV